MNPNRNRNPNPNPNPYPNPNPILARRLQPDSAEVAEYLVRWKGYSEVSLALRTLTQGRG